MQWDGFEDEMGVIEGRWVKYLAEFLFTPNVLSYHVMLVQEPRWRALSRRHQRLASEQQRLVYKERTICPIESGRGENYNNPWVCPGLLLYQSFLVSDVYFFGAFG